MKSFLTQLKDIQDNFLNYASEKANKVDKNSLEVNCCKDGLSMYVEAYDSNGCIITFRQEIIQNGKQLEPCDIITEF